MAQTAMTVRMDNQQKAQFDKLCEQFGMSANTAINIFVKAVIRSKSIPFSIQVKEEDEVTAKAKAAFKELRAKADRGETPELTLDEINEEIREVRRLRKERNVYAVIDTNIFVSALITHNSNASTARVLESLFLHRIIPLYNDDIIKEYDEVLHRAKFKLSDDQICTVIELVKQNGIDSSRFPYAGEMPDEDDRVFYEICLSKEDSFLVTGNLKHFPKEPQVITAAEMMEILDNEL